MNPPTSLPDRPPAPADLLAHLDGSGPRYTSYPTADRFVDSFGPSEHRQALRAHARAGQGSAGRSPWSVYVHLPFCESVCYFCACNKIVTRRHERAAGYLETLAAELDLHLAELGPRQPVEQIHLGGGTPTFLSDPELACLMQLLRRSFAVDADAEVSIEVDPRTIGPDRLARLRSSGFNRLSLGVQDFDAEVQRAVHRQQSLESVQVLLHAARELGFASVNLDLIYGLPRQSSASLRRTLRQVCELRPDRIALYAYAHLPARFAPQRRIDASLLPSPLQKIELLAQAIDAFTRAGYQHVGMDHFALPEDSLAVARRDGSLQRNFQGYGTGRDLDLMGLGVSAISRVGATYSQNAKTLAKYSDAISNGRFATERGIALSSEDLLRRAVIMALMCQGRVAFESIARTHRVDAAALFRAEMRALEPFQSQGLVRLAPEAIEVTERGWYAVRAIAMVFDRRLQAERDAPGRPPDAQPSGRGISRPGQ